DASAQLPLPLSLASRMFATTSTGNSFPRSVAQALGAGMQLMPASGSVRVRPSSQPMRRRRAPANVQRRSMSANIPRGQPTVPDGTRTASTFSGAAGRRSVLARRPPGFGSPADGAPDARSTAHGCGGTGGRLALVPRVVGRLVDALGPVVERAVDADVE